MSLDLDLDLNEVRQNQPTINVGMIGSVANGKSSLTKIITGTSTLRDSSELKRNITIKLGYANAKIYKCSKCPPPICYQSFGSDVNEALCKHCHTEMELKKHISFTDCPGHNMLLATMLNGTSVMDNTILVEAINNMEIPAPQTREHLLVADITQLKNSIVVMNKMDLAKPNKVKDQIQEFKTYLQKTVANTSPIVPIVANFGINVDVVCEYICNLIEEPVRQLDTDLKMIVIRSFNINQQNIPIQDLKGGVIGGTVMKGLLKLDQNVMILPGMINLNSEYQEELYGTDEYKPKWLFEPIIGRVLSINTENNPLSFAIPGGLIGVQLDIDPSFTAKDGLVGSIVTINSELEKINYKILEVLFVELEILDRDNIELKKGEEIQINYNACNNKARINHINKRKTKAEIILIQRPVCIEIGDYITISRQKGTSISVAGRGKVIDGIDSKYNRI